MGILRYFVLIMQLEKYASNIVYGELNRLWHIGIVKIIRGPHGDTINGRTNYAIPYYYWAFIKI